MKRSDLELTLETQMRAVRIPEWKAEDMFHPVRRWRFDFSWPAEMLAVEIEGATWAQGRHSRGGGFGDDCIKYAEATLLGWRVLRFTGDQVKDGTALRYIEAALGVKA